MMNKLFSWEFGEHADKSFRKLDISVQKRIVKWLNSHIEGCSNPKVWGKDLHGKLGDFWRYRVGKYRLVTRIHYNKFIVTVLKTAKRGQVYK